MWNVFLKSFSKTRFTFRFCIRLVSAPEVIFFPVTKNTGVSVKRLLLRICSKNSYPSISGITISTQKASNRLLDAFFNPSWPSTAVSTLYPAGYKVETAVDGHDGLKKASSNRFDAFCVDIVMPLMDGYEFLEQIRNNKRFTDTPVFLVTGKNITSGAETRRIQNLNVKRVFEKLFKNTFHI